KGVRSIREPGQRVHRWYRAVARPDALLVVRSSGIRLVRVVRAGQNPLTGDRAGRFADSRGCVGQRGPHAASLPDLGETREIAGVPARSTVADASGWHPSEHLDADLAGGDLAQGRHR